MLNTDRLCIGCMNDNGGERVCSICGYDSEKANGDNCLPIKYWLKDRYYIGRVLDSNGEGITYIGWDNKNDSIVNVREYFPTGACLRKKDLAVGIVPGNEFAFNDGIMKFIELHKKIATYSDLPALLPVIEVFEENGTAYSIIKSVPGISLREFLIRNGGNLSWEQARPLFLPLITTVSALHEGGILHRGISPDTIIVGRDGKLRLSGICIRAARMSKSSLSVQLYPGFSAIEQYGFDMEVGDGRHTDVYGMAATLFRVLMGAAPTDASERISNDNMQIPASVADTLPKYVLSALANALQIMPADRTADMDSFRISMTPVAADTTPTYKTEKVLVHRKPAEKQNISKPAEREASSSKKYAIISSAVTAGIMIVLGVFVYIIFGGNPSTPSGQPSVPVDSSQPEQVSSEIPSGNSSSNTSQKLYQVPELIGKPYAEIVENTDYTVYFSFAVKDKQFSDKYPKGYVIDQVQKSDQSVQKGSTIELTLSLGPKEVAVANIVGMTKEQATIELLKQGFLYENITFLDAYDAKKPSSVVIAVEPSAGSKVDTDIRITVRINGVIKNQTSDNSSQSQTSTNNTSSTR